MCKLTLAVTAAATAVAAPAFAADLNVSVEIPRLSVAAYNLFDVEVEVSETGDGVSGFGPPRTLSLGVRLSL